MKRIAAAFALVLSASAQAGDLSSVGNLTQEQFRRLSEDLGAAVSYKGVTPATPLGIVGFDIGVVATTTDIRNSSVFALAGAGGKSDIQTAKLHIYKGLVAGLDLGGFIGVTNGVSGEIYGVDLRYAFLDDTLTTPAFGVRASGTMTNGLGAVDVSTLGLDFLLSKRFAVATPYAGIGVVRVMSEPGVGGLQEENFTKGRGFVGLNVNLAVINVAFEAEKMGDNTSLSAKLGWRF
ncbi:hypothetical protein BWI17_05620 [Betaproteobacteria bacterium GR16-43]|nr:hypothetical protein BWI17_05620 [Betaproteobacteria bacterium GR16-43]